MQLIMVRHGEANPVDGIEIKKDSQRTLTERGQAQAHETAAYITSQYMPDLLVVSPFVRAQQTMQACEVAIAKTDAVKPPLIYDGIIPTGDDKKALVFLSELAEAKAAKCMLVVCHMDIVARLHGRLVGENPIAFSLAEARVYEQIVLADALSTQTANFVPTNFCS